MYLWSNKVSPSSISYILQNTDIPLTFFCILFYALFYLALLVLYSPRVLSCVCMVKSSSMISIFSFIEIPPWRFIILYQRGFLNPYWRRSPATSNLCFLHCIQIESHKLKIPESGLPGKPGYFSSWNHLCWPA